MSSNDGKTENWSGSFIFIEIKSTINAREILHIIKKLNAHVGNGIISMVTIKMTPAITGISLKSLALIRFLS
ncbi:hypothetical protein BCO26_1151 [Heyndrickxia coagulans 2-6]|nr:hypothetical protein BCO26_1151 [Heyndrickxia coagulans 2-6]